MRRLSTHYGFVRFRVWLEISVRGVTLRKTGPEPAADDREFTSPSIRLGTTGTHRPVSRPAPPISGAGESQDDPRTPTMKVVSSSAPRRARRAGLAPWSRPPRGLRRIAMLELPLRQTTARRRAAALAAAHNRNDAPPPAGGSQTAAVIINLQCARVNGTRWKIAGPVHAAREEQPLQRAEPSRTSREGADETPTSVLVSSMY